MDLMLMVGGQDYLRASLNKSGFHILHMQIGENTKQEKITWSTRPPSTRRLKQLLKRD